MSKFSIGKIMAFICGLIVVFFAWGMVFVPGGLGSNIILGIFAAIMGVYWFTKHFGNYLDIQFFHKGSKARAATLIQAEKQLLDIRLHLKATKKVTTAGQLNPILVQIEALERTIAEIKNNLVGDVGVAQGQVNRLNEGMSKLKKLMGDTFGKRKSSNGWASLVFALVVALAVRAFIVEPFQIPSGSMFPVLKIGDHLFVSKLEYGIVNPFSSPGSYFYRWGTPKPGDVIVFEAPSYVGHHAGQPWIKRVIAGPGQTVSIRDAKVYVDNQVYPHVSAGELVTYMNYFENGEESFWQQDTAIQTTEKIGNISHNIYLRPPSERYAFENNWPLYPKEFPGVKCSASECVVSPGYLFVMGDNRGGSKDSRFWGGLPIEMVKGRALLIWMSVDGSKNLISWGNFAIPSFRIDRWFTMIN